MTVHILKVECCDWNVLKWKVLNGETIKLKIMSANISHILTFCSAYSDIRIRILEEFSYLCLQVKSVLDFSELMTDSETLCQFILDPSSFNLKQRVHMNDPLLGSFFRVSRDLCFAVNERRMKLLKEKKKNL